MTYLSIIVTLMFLESTAFRLWVLHREYKKYKAVPDLNFDIDWDKMLKDAGDKNEWAYENEIPAGPPINDQLLKIRKKNKTAKKKRGKK